MIQRAGVNPDAFDILAPGQGKRLREQPSAMAFAREFGDEAEKADQALARFAEDWARFRDSVDQLVNPRGTS